MALGMTLAATLRERLARLIEAAAGLPLLPSVKSESGFLCGMEFDSLRSKSQSVASYIGFPAAATYLPRP
jgi:hypothetical protein